MNAILWLRKRGPFLGLVAFVFSVVCACAQTPTLTVSPSSITNDYVGKITLTVSNLVAGKTVAIQRFADLDGNGVADPTQEPLLQQVLVRDGWLPLIGGVRNVGVPGDEDGLTNGVIRVELNYPGLNQVLEHFSGNFLFRVADPTRVFSPVTVPFVVVQKAYPQGVSGVVRSAANGQALANAMVALVPAHGNDGLGAIADAAGHFSISYLPGDYAVVAIKNGYVSDEGGAQVTIGPNASVVMNVTNVVATRFLAGSVSDSSSGAGLGGIFIQAETTNNLGAFGFTTTNGTFAIPVTADQWKVKVSADSGLAAAGYVAFQTPVVTNTFGGNVSNLNLAFPKGTSLIYGRVLDNFSNPVPALAIYAQDQSYIYESACRSTVDGSYGVAVFGGSWWVGPGDDDLAATGLVGQGASVSITNGQALLQNQDLQRPSSHIRGRVVDSFGSAVGNAGLVVFLQNTNGPGSISLSFKTAGDGSFDAGVFGGTWNVALECGEAASRGLVSPSLLVVVVDGVDRTNLTLIALAATGFITGTIRDGSGNPVNADAYAALFLNGTNYSACDGNGGSSFSIPVFNGTWQVGISGDLTSRGYDYPPTQPVTLSGGAGTANFTLYPLGQTPPLLSFLNYYQGQIQFTLLGDPDRVYRIEVTTNLNNPAAWVPVRTNTAYGGNFTFTDTNSLSAPRRYYRARLMQ